MGLGLGVPGLGRLEFLESHCMWLHSKILGPAPEKCVSDFVRHEALSRGCFVL